MQLSPLSCQLLLAPWLSGRLTLLWFGIAVAVDISASLGFSRLLRLSCEVRRS